MHPIERRLRQHPLRWAFVCSFLALLLMGFVLLATYGLMWVFTTYLEPYHFYGVLGVIAFAVWTLWFWRWFKEM